MSLFQKKIGTVFFKESSETAEYIEKLQELRDKTEGTLKQDIEKQIRIAKYGADGENTVAYELKTSGMDMYVLHDVYLEINDLSAQIDYIVITRKRVYILECKNLIGDIEIDSSGSFVRTYEWSGKKVREGIYSPITQNKRHLQVLKELRKSSKNNLISRMIFEKNFDEIHKSIVVLANPKTCLRARYAPNEIKKQVIRADQLITYIQQMDSLVRENTMSEKQMRELAVFYLEKNVPEHSDYAEKYRLMIENMKAEEMNNSEEAKDKRDAGELEPPGKTKEPVEDLVRRLKEFRKEQSRKEGIKAYYIFNDAQMMDLIQKNPATREELLKVSGFGKVKIEKYGDEILSVLHPQDK